MLSQVMQRFSLQCGGGAAAAAQPPPRAQKSIVLSVLSDDSDEDFVTLITADAHTKQET